VTSNSSRFISMKKEVNSNRQKKGKKKKEKNESPITLL